MSCNPWRGPTLTPTHAACPCKRLCDRGTNHTANRTVLQWLCYCIAGEWEKNSARKFTAKVRRYILSVRKYGIHHDNAVHPPLHLRCHTCLQCTLYKARHSEDGWISKLLQSSSLYVTEKSSISRRARDGKLEARHVMAPCLLSEFWETGLR